MKGSFQGLLFSFLMLSGFCLRAQNDCPTWKWATDLGLPPQVTVHEMQVDTAGNVYVAATFSGTFFLAGTTLTTSDTSHFVAKFGASNNTWHWVKQFEANLTGSYAGWPVSIDLEYDERGLLSVYGIFSSAAGFDNLSVTTSLSGPNNFVARLNTSTLQWDWVNYAEGPVYMDASSMAVAADGSTYISGRVLKYTPGYDTLYFGAHNIAINDKSVYLAKLDSLGNWLWVEHVSNVENKPLVALENGQSPTVATTFSGTLNFASQSISSSNYGIAVLGFSPSGQEVWMQTALGQNQVSPRNSYLGYDGAGSLYIAGTSFLDNIQFGSTLLNSNPDLNYVAKINSQKNWSWAEQIQSTGLSFYALDGVTTLQGNTYFTTRFGNRMTFGSDSLVSNSIVNIAVAKIDSSGQWQWAGMAYAPNPTNGSSTRTIAVNVNHKEEVSITGYHSETVYFGNYTTASSGNFVAVIKPDSIVQFILPKDTTLACGDSIKIVPRTSSVAQLYYSWSPGIGLSDSTVYDPIANPDKTTTYTVTAYTQGGCSVTDQITIDRDSTAWYGTGIPLSTSTGNNMFCDNSNFSISAPANYQSYRWNTGDLTASITINKPGTYVLTAKDENGCYKKDSLVIVGPVSILPKVPLLCVNDSVAIQINPQGLDSLRWNNGNVNPVQYVLQPGKYWVTVYKGTCIYTDSIEVDLFIDTANATFSTHIVNLDVDFSPNSIGVVSGHWDFGDGVSSTGINVSHTYTSNGLYNVCFTATDVCGYQAKHCVNVKVPNIGIDELVQKGKYTFYPNPVSNIIYIESTDEETPLIRLYDLSGKVVYDQRLVSAKHWKIDIGHLPASYYFINIDGNTSKLVKL